MLENYGQIVQVIGPSVDIRFPAASPFRLLAAGRPAATPNVRSWRDP